MYLIDFLLYDHLGHVALTIIIPLFVLASAMCGMIAYLHVSTERERKNRDRK